LNDEDQNDESVVENLTILDGLIIATSVDGRSAVTNLTINNGNISAFSSGSGAGIGTGLSSLFNWYQDSYSVVTNLNISGGHIDTTGLSGAGIG
jgi:ABC-type uncharacterized transport system YnjBCD ATPase subunit